MGMLSNRSSVAHNTSAAQADRSVVIDGHSQQKTFLMGDKCQRGRLASEPRVASARGAERPRPRKQLSVWWQG